MSQSVPSLLFDAHEELQLTMPLDFDALCRPSESSDCGFTPSEFRYHDADGNERAVPISIRRREGWRAQMTNCQVPTLFIRFSQTDAAGTPFEGQSTLALTSHCGKGISPGGDRSLELPSDFERYVINEYLGYRLYNLVTDASLNVRLVRIRYAHPDNPRLDITRDAFFAEHFEALAERLGAELLPSQSYDPEDLDIPAADQLALFQYMIGNTDWSIEDQQNVILIRSPGGRQVPVLFDLDLSGLVNAHYALPASGLPIDSVRQRYYMGHCHADTDWEGLFTKFQGLRKDFFTLLAETPGLGRGDRRTTGVYLDSFFSIIGSRESRQQQIVNACRPESPAPNA
jgi:hypothetical protein